MRRAKIVCTIGPATASAEQIQALVDAGMDVARINRSHGTAEEHEEVVERVRRAAQNSGRGIAVLVDLQGPKIRLSQHNTCRTKFCIPQRQQMIAQRIEAAKCQMRGQTGAQSGGREGSGHGEREVAMNEAEGNEAGRRTPYIYIRRVAMAIQGVCGSKAAHSSQPAAGVSAVNRAIPVAPRSLHDESGGTCRQAARL